MKVGNKIRQLRELRNYSQENMAEALKMSVNGYSKIERNEVDINIGRLQDIAKALEMKPEDILAFDEKFVFNNYDKGASGIFHNCTFSDNEKKLYEDKIRLLEEKILYLQQENKRLQG